LIERPAGALLLAACLLVADGAAAGNAALRPYSAKYKTTAHGLQLTLDRELEENSDGSYTLTNGGSILVVGFHEMSVFRVQDNEVIPGTYVFQGTGLINRRREVHFTPGADTIRSLYKDKWYELPYSAHTLDRMSQMEQVRLQLMNDPEPDRDITVRIADGRKVKEYLLQFVARETLETPLGPLETLHFRRGHADPEERQSDTWMAPDLDYLMVKTVHVEKGTPVEMMLTDAHLRTADTAAR